VADEKGRNKKKREQKIKRLLGINLCACGSGHQLRCHGVCKKAHTNPSTGKVECGEMYQIDHSEIKLGGPRRPKRTWRYGRQKDENDDEQTKQRRRAKWERNRME
jgi:hypothetical protein